MKIDAIEIRRYRLPLDPPFCASWDPRPRTSMSSTIVRVRSGDYEGVGSGDDMLGFAGTRGSRSSATTSSISNATPPSSTT